MSGLCCELLASAVSTRLGGKQIMQNERKEGLRTLCAVLVLALFAIMMPLRAAAQDDDDPPGRAARLGHVEGSVSFQPAGESEWVEAMPNRPMTTGDRLWSDRDSRADVELGSTSVHLNSNTGFSFLNLDDRTIQIQLSSGTITLRVRRLNDDDVVEVDTANQAFSVFRPGRYRIEASEDGTYTVITVREGEGESSGNDQSYTVHQGQRATFSGTDRLRADVEQAGDNLDDFDQWSYRRDHRFDESASARYVSREVVGSEDLDDYGDWHPSGEYGAVWYPRVDAGWAPYHAGHWAWVDPWGWTWVDDAPWGYAPFHYGRWAFVEGRWGWVPGPVESRPVYAPALVVFVGGGGPAMGGNVAWFPLGPREVYVPSYHVSAAYVNRVNISNTVVTQTTITNVYNTTVINNNNTRVVNNVTYANRNVSGAVTAVPQQAFAGGQSVARASVPVNREQLAAASVGARVSVAPSRTAVMGVHAQAAVRVAAPPAAVLNRPAIAKVAPPPAPVPFAVKQQAMEAHPGQPLARQEMQRIRPANSPTQPMVRQVPASANVARPANQLGTPPAANRMQPTPPAMSQPAMSRPAANDRPAPAQPQPPAANRPQPNPPAMNQPAMNQPAMTRPAANDRPAPAQPQPPAANRPQPNPPAMNQPAMSRPAEPNRPFAPPARSDRPVNERPMNDRPAAVPPVTHTQPQSAPAENPRPAQNPAPAIRPEPATPPPAAARPPQPGQHPQPPEPPAKPRPDDKKKHPVDPPKNQ
jgi:hypothetical protein